MKYRPLGQTDINVSQICLGSMTWGQQNSEAEAHEQLDYAVDQGINFIDAAEMYPTPPKAETQGLTETYIGNWLKKRTDRDKLIISSKVSGAAVWLSHIRDGKTALDRKNIEAAVDASLKRLQTDYIDLYQTHWPDRDTNFFGKLGYYHAPDKDVTTIEETLTVMQDLIKAGKIRQVGVSNETPWGVSEHLQQATQQELPRIVSIQNPYSLLNRTFEVGLAEFSHREQIGLLAYSPTAFGSLSGKYLHDAKPEGARLTLYSHFARYTNELASNATEKYVKLARDYALDPAQMALAFVNTRGFVTSTIIGATQIQQLKSNIDSIDIELPKELLKEIDVIHSSQPNPCP